MGLSLMLVNLFPILQCVHATARQQINTIFTCGYIVGMIPSEYKPHCAGWRKVDLGCPRQYDVTNRASQDMVPRNADRLGCFNILVRGIEAANRATASNHICKSVLVQLPTCSRYVHTTTFFCMHIHLLDICHPVLPGHRGIINVCRDPLYPRIVRFCHSSRDF